MTFAALIAVATLAAAGTDDVVARVGEAAIARSTLERRLRAISAQGRPARPDRALDELIAEALLAAEATRLRVTGTPEVVARIELERRRAAADALVEKEVGAVNPDDALLREMFHSTADFVSYDALTFEKRDAAEAASRRLVSGAAKPEEEARRADVSRIHPDKEKALPSMRAQLERPLADALFSAALSSWAGPVQVSTGFAVVRPLRREVGTDAAFREKRPALVERARKQLAAQMRKHLVAQLRAAAEVTLDEQFLRSLQGTNATPAQLEHAFATVNGHPLRYRDIYPSVLTLAASIGGHASGPALKRQLASQAVDDRVLEDVAIARGLGDSPHVTARLPEIRAAALAQAAAAAIAAATPAPGEDEIQAFYERNAGRYGRPFAEVLPDVAARAASEKRAEAVRARVEKLRKTAAVSVDRGALTRLSSAGT
jgi:hypothetical protein